MRRPVFGHFPVVKEGPAGIGVIFAGEDCDFVEKSRLVAIEQHYDTSLQGLVYTANNAIPVDPRDKTLLSDYRDELRRLQDETGKAIETIANDTLKRSLGSLRQNDDDAARRFCAVMEELADEFGCTILCNAHQPKHGAEGMIAGSGDFIANCPVTPHIKGITERKKLIGMECEFEPKFRVGPKPDPFSVRATAVVLPRPVAGFPTDFVFVYSGAAVLSQRDREKQGRLQLVQDFLAERPLDCFVTADLATKLAQKSEHDMENWRRFLNNAARDDKVPDLYDMEERGRTRKKTRLWRASQSAKRPDWPAIVSNNRKQPEIPLNYQLPLAQLGGI